MESSYAPGSFKELSLSPQIIRAIDDIGYTKPTAIQAKAIPFLLEGHDLIGRSCTGSGKTGAFSIPAIEGCRNNASHVQVLVLSPTRELAMQIHVEMKKFAKYKEGVYPVVVYGGASMSDQIKQLKKANIVIGTPGRLMDHLRRRTLKLDQVKTVILDEADEMLNMGFIEDIETILGHVPGTRQTVLFRQPCQLPLLKISKTFLTDPITVETFSEKESQADIEQTYYQVAQGKKKDVLSLLLRANEQRSIVFCNTKSMVDELSEMLRKQGFKVSGLHGDMTQAARSQVMQGFRGGSIQTLIATDVAARGIDVNDIDVVINYDLPQSFEYYVHRIGRTGRAGRQGISQTLICNGRQYSTLRSLMKYTGIPIQEQKLPTGDEIREKTVEKTAERVRGLAHPGKAARQLVHSLMEDPGFEGSDKQVALALAELLIGGDEQFDRLKGMEALTQKPSRKKNFKTSNAGSKRKRSGKAYAEKRLGSDEQSKSAGSSKKNAGRQRRQKPEDKGNSQNFGGKKKSRTRAKQYTNV